MRNIMRKMSEQELSNRTILSLYFNQFGNFLESLDGGFGPIYEGNSLVRAFLLRRF